MIFATDFELFANDIEWFSAIFTYRAYFSTISNIRKTIVDIFIIHEQISVRYEK